jgi:hypothetical protein
MGFFTRRTKLEELPGVITAFFAFGILCAELGRSDGNPIVWVPMIIVGIVFAILGNKFGGRKK